MPAYVYYGKTKLARGFSYPVSRTTVDALIDSGVLKNLTGLAFVGPSANGRLLCARYSAPRTRNESLELSLWLNAAPSSISRTLRDLLTAEGLPALAAWTARFSDETLTHSQLDHTFTATYDQLPGRDAARPQFKLVFAEDNID